MSLIFCFLTVQGSNPKQDHGCCECWKIDMGCFMQQSSWDLEVISDDQFSLCVPTKKKISDFLEQLIVPMSSKIRPRHTFHKVKGCAASASVCLVLLLLAYCPSGFDPTFLHTLPSPIFPQILACWLYRFVPGPWALWWEDTSVAHSGPSSICSVYAVSFYSFKQGGAK